MICPFCGKEIKSGSKFCAKCGHEMPCCPKCGVNLTQKVKFCKNCGTQISEELVAELKIGQRKKKRKFPLILVLLIVLIIVLIGSLVVVEVAHGVLPANDSASLVVEADNTDTDEMSGFDSPEESGEEMPRIGVAESDSAVNKDNIDNNKTTQIDVQTEHYYEVVASDISWTDANEAAQKAGGHLATITSESEFMEVCDVADKSGLKYLWLGALLTSSKKDWGDANTWITGEEWTYENWYPGEPSKEDADGTKEYYLCLWDAQYDGKNIGWTFNDQRNDIVKDFDECKGKVGYIIEYGDDNE